MPDYYQLLCELRRLVDDAPHWESPSHREARITAFKEACWAYWKDMETQIQERAQHA